MVALQGHRNPGQILGPSEIPSPQETPDLGHSPKLLQCRLGARRTNGPVWWESCSEGSLRVVVRLHEPRGSAPDLAGEARTVPVRSRPLVAGSLVQDLGHSPLACPSDS